MSDTQIFKTYQDFLERSDKKLNGVSEEFAANNSEFAKQNETNEGCWNCSECRSCRSCRSCSECRYCRYCSDCRYCRSCSECRYCRSCSEFKSNPQKIVSDFIGSRKSQSTYYWNEEKEKMVCGCFSGTLDEFKKAVEKTHGDNEHGLAYKKWIGSIEKYLETLKN